MAFTFSCTGASAPRGKYVSGAREATQKEVADLLGISQSYISRLEKRIIAHLRQEMLKQMQC